MQFDKTIYKVKVRKAHHVINMILGIISFSVLLSLHRDDSDYALLNQLLQESTTASHNKTILLNASGDNRYISGMIRELRDSISIAHRNDKWPPYEIGRDSVFAKIFNKSEYDYMISQEDTTSWDFSRITVPNISKYNKNKKVNKQLKLFVSKPIFTKNKKYALIGFADGSISYVIIYRKDTGQWIKYKTISHMIN